jgi:ABC-type multidrug transport system fused ATPase/permease subunit
MSCIEVVSVIAIGPFMALLGDMDSIQAPGIFNEIYNYLGFTSNREFIIFVGALVLSIMLFSACFSLYTIKVLFQFGSSIGGAISNRLFKHYLFQPWLFHSDHSSSSLIHKVINESQRLTFAIIHQALNFNAKAAIAVLMSLAVVIYDPAISISGLAIFSISYFLIYKLSESHLNRASKSLAEDQAIRLKTASESFGGIQNIILNRTQPFFINTFNKSTDKYYFAWGNSQVLGITPKYLLEVLAMGSIIILVLFLFLSNNQNLSTILPTLSVFALAGYKILPALHTAYYSFSIITANISAFESLKSDLINSSDIDQSAQNLQMKSNDKIEFNNKLSFKNISFTYPESVKKVLNDVSFEIQAETTIGIVGPSGAGKSTMIDIILGLINPISGNFFADNETIDKSNIELWQRNIGFVPQSIFLSDSTIKENIAFGINAQSIDNKKLLKAANLANIMDFLSSLPNGLDTIVGERGIQLSGGQIQRIGIARALYNNPNVLIFDEATSSLDGISEKLIMEAINKFSGQKTIIIVAHRLETVKNCDSILLLKDGEIIDTGSYDELLSRSLVFQEMAGS